MSLFRSLSGATVAGCVLLAAQSTDAQAQSVTVKPLIDARIRFDSFEQGGMPRESDALTMRVRPGVAIAHDRWSAIVEGEATLGIVRRFNDGFNGRTDRPLIPDADNLELNRLQVRYDAPNLAVTAGRQVLEVADQRFIGSANFRQNQQTFDAVRLQSKPASQVVFDIGYAWNVRTTVGRLGRGPRPASIGGDNVFAVIGYAAPIGTLTGFAYVIDQDRAEVQSFRLENQTYGVRFAGSRPVFAGAKLAYAASYARQQQTHRNPNRYTADYYTGEATLSFAHVAGTVGYEVLGASDGRALTSFQTPDSSAFRFQGWAGRFITTPPDGVRDLYATVAPVWKTHGPIDTVSAGVTVHRFESDRLVRHYGNEVDLLGSVHLKRTTLSARYAWYDADRFATDVHHFWLSVDWIL